MPWTVGCPIILGSSNLYLRCRNFMDNNSMGEVYDFENQYLIVDVGGMDSSLMGVHSNLDIVIKSIRHFLFTILNNSLYQM